MVTINGTNGIDKVQDGTIHEANINADVARLGIGQTWQNVSASRSFNTDYTNTTGKPIIVCVTVTPNGTSSSAGIAVSGVTVDYVQGFVALAIGQILQAMVPNGAIYRVGPVGTTGLTGWVELR